MAKIEVSPYFESISGKLCRRKNQMICLNKKTGKMYAAECHHDYDPNTPDQQASRAKFTQRSKAASAWWHANAPKTKTEPLKPQYQVFIEKYKAQNVYGNRYSFLCSLVKEDGTIDLPEGNTSGGQQGGGGSSGGDGLG